MYKLYSHHASAVMRRGAEHVTTSRPRGKSAVMIECYFAL